MSWLIATIASHCRYPNKKNKKLRTEDFYRSGQDKDNLKNPFYRQVMNIKR